MKSEVFSAVFLGAMLLCQPCFSQSDKPDKAGSQSPPAAVSVKQATTDPVETQLLAALTNPALTPAQRLQVLTALLQLHLQTKAYDKLVLRSQDVLALDANNGLVRLQQAQALLLLGQDNKAVAAVQEKMRRDETQNILPTEAELRVLLRAYQRLKNEMGYMDALLRLLTHHQKQLDGSRNPNAKAYWQDLLTKRIDQLQSANKPDKRVLYGFYRLLHATQNLEEADDILEAGLLALDAGQPHEALRMLGLPHIPQPQIDPQIKTAILRAQGLAKADAADAAAIKQPWEQSTEPARWEELIRLWGLLAK